MQKFSFAEDKENFVFSRQILIRSRLLMCALWNHIVLNLFMQVYEESCTNWVVKTFTVIIIKVCNALITLSLC